MLIFDRKDIEIDPSLGDNYRIFERDLKCVEIF